LSWQIVPTVLQRLLRDKDAAKSRRAMETMPKMTKLDIGLFTQAFEQG